MKIALNHFLYLLILSCLTASAYSENLLIKKDLSAPQNWGVIANNPLETGQVKLENEILTLIRKKIGGDFKLYKVLPKLKSNTKYRFLCKLKKNGGGVARLKIINFMGKGWTVLADQEVAKGGDWQDLEVAFNCPENSDKICIQFFPPDEINSSTSIAQMILLPASDTTPLTKLLKPVVIKNVYKPVKHVETLVDAEIYRNENILLNGNFEKRNINIDTPLYWQHGYRQDTAEYKKCFSLKDKIFSFQSPFSISQTIDITQEVATKYVLSFNAKVKSGKLICAVNTRSLVDQKDNSLFSKRIQQSPDWQEIKCQFEIKPSECPGAFRIIFMTDKKEESNVDLTDLKLQPIDPEIAENHKSINIDGQNNMHPLRGICIPKAHSYYELKAAKFFRKYIFKATGVLPSIYLLKHDEIKNRSGLVFIGNDYIPEKQKEKLKAGGFAIESKNGILCIGGNKDDDGAIHGVFAVLQSLGMEFFTTVNHTMPTDKILCIKEGVLTRNPAFGYHFASGAIRTSFDSIGYTDIRTWAQPNLLGRWMGGGEHTAQFLVDPNLYFKTHPEYYAMDKNGERKWPSRGPCDLHLCMSNPDVQKIAVETMLKWIEAEPWAKIFFVSGGDGHAWCMCENCKKWDVETDVPGGTLSDRNIRFVNIIAREVAKKYPDKVIMTLAYCGCRKIPSRVKPEPNVWVAYCPYPPSWNCWRHFMCSKNLRGMKELLEWAQKFPEHLYIYDYPNLGDTYPYFGLQPKGGLYAMVNKIRMYSAFGVKGISFNGHGSYKHLFNYVMNKLIWNPHTDVETHIDKFMKFYYGKAAPAMRIYFNLVHEKEKARSLHRYDQAITMVDEKFFNEGEKLLNQAIAIAEKNKVKGIEEIYEQKMKLLAAYLAFNNKSKGLKGEKLKRYAINLAELLKLYKRFKVTKPEYRKTMRDILVRYAKLDIGNYKPWYKSPVITELWNNPVDVLTKKVYSYEKTEDGLKFHLPLFVGGGELKNYQYEGLPKTTRPFSKVLRRASSPYSKISTEFELKAIPQQEVTITLEGLDDEKPENASFAITINNIKVFDAIGSFNKDDWSNMTIKVPAEVLKTGTNSLEIQNTTKDKLATPTFTEVEAPQKDYNWGWFLLSNINIKFE